MAGPLADIGNRVEALAAQLPTFTLIEDLRIFPINAESVNLRYRKRRECHGGDFRSRKSDGANKGVAGFRFARLWLPFFANLQLPGAEQTDKILCTQRKMSSERNRGGQHRFGNRVLLRRCALEFQPDDEGRNMITAGIAAVAGRQTPTREVLNALTNCLWPPQNAFLSHQTGRVSELIFFCENDALFENLVFKTGSASNSFMAR
jgi:hypothetical protein